MTSRYSQTVAAVRSDKALLIVNRVKRDEISQVIIESLERSVATVSSTEPESLYLRA